MKKLLLSIFNSRLLSSVSCLLFYVFCLLSSILCLTFVCFTFVSQLNAAFKYDNYSVRASGLGSAFVGVADDSNALLFNPAGIAQIEKPEVNFMYSKLFYGLEDVNLSSNFAGFVYPILKVGSLGFYWTNFVSLNEYSEDIFGFSYGIPVSENIYLGLTLKYLGHKYFIDKRTENDPVFSNGKNSKYDISVDFGTLAKFENLSLGFSVKNVNEPDIGLKTEDKVSMQITAGLGCNVDEFLFLKNFLIVFDISYRAQQWGSNFDKLNFNLGFEFYPIKQLTIRVGGNTSEFSLGSGINFSKISIFEFQLDYAFLYPLYIKETIGTHRISLVCRFGH